MGRSLQDLIGTLGELQAKGVGLYLHQEGIDTTTPAGKALFQMLGVFAEFERAMIRERIMAGLARAKAQDKKLGRPEVSDKVKAAICRERAKLRHQKDCWLGRLWGGDGAEGDYRHLKDLGATDALRLVVAF